MPKPPLGKVAVGDQLLVIRSFSRFRDNDPVPVTVTKAGRVWVELAPESGGMAWRMRIDTQDGGSGYGYGDRFVTQEQYEWEQRVTAARNVLREARLIPDGASPWHRDDRLLALAEFVRTYDEQHPA